MQAGAFPWLVQMAEGYSSRYQSALPPHPPVCYKRYMRKWMRERLKRRKKGGEGEAKEPASKPAPLQPDFYSDQSAAPAAPVVEFQPETFPEAEAAEPEPAAPEVEAPVAGAQPVQRPSRRRRGRGGRSRQRGG